MQLKKIINDIPGFEVNAESDNKEELYNQLDKKSCDIVIVDLKFQGNMEGLEILKTIKLKWPEIKVMILSEYFNKTIIEEAVKLGADGYITKNDIFDTIKNSLELITKGKKTFSTKIKSYMFDTFFQDNDSSVSLTEKEKEVLRMIVQGKRRKEIAYELGISISTVDFHKTNIRAKLGADSDLDLYKLSQNKKYI